MTTSVVGDEGTVKGRSKVLSGIMKKAVTSSFCRVNDTAVTATARRRSSESIVFFSKETRGHFALLCQSYCIMRGEFAREA